MSSEYGPLNFNELKINDKKLDNDIIEKIKNLEKITINTIKLYKNDVENLAKKLLEKEIKDYIDIIDTLDQSLENTLSIKFEN